MSYEYVITELVNTHSTISEYAIDVPGPVSFDCDTPTSSNAVTTMDYPVKTIVTRTGTYCWAGPTANGRVFCDSEEAAHFLQQFLPKP